MMLLEKQLLVNGESAAGGDRSTKRARTTSGAPPTHVTTTWVEMSRSVFSPLNIHFRSSILSILCLQTSVKLLSPSSFLLLHKGNIKTYLHKKYLNVELEGVLWQMESVSFMQENLHRIIFSIKRLFVSQNPYF